MNLATRLRMNVLAELQTPRPAILEGDGGGGMGAPEVTADQHLQHALKHAQAAHSLNAKDPGKAFQHSQAAEAHLKQSSLKQNAEDAPEKHPGEKMVFGVWRKAGALSPEEHTQTAHKYTRHAARQKARLDTRNLLAGKHPSTLAPEQVGHQYHEVKQSLALAHAHHSGQDPMQHAAGERTGAAPQNASRFHTMLSLAEGAAEGDDDPDHKAALHHAAEFRKASDRGDRTARAHHLHHEEMHTAAMRKRLAGPGDMDRPEQHPGEKMVFGAWRKVGELAPHEHQALAVHHARRAKLFHKLADVADVHNGHAPGADPENPSREAARHDEHFSAEHAAGRDPWLQSQKDQAAKDAARAARSKPQNASRFRTMMSLAEATTRPAAPPGHPGQKMVFGVWRNTKGQMASTPGEHKAAAQHHSKLAKAHKAKADDIMDKADRNSEELEFQDTHETTPGKAAHAHYALAAAHAHQANHHTIHATVPGQQNKPMPHTADASLPQIMAKHGASTQNEPAIRLRDGAHSDD